MAAPEKPMSVSQDVRQDAGGVDYRISVKYDIPSLLLFLFVFACVTLLLYWNREDLKPFEQLVCFTFLAAMISHTLLCLFDRRPALVLDENGLFYRRFMDRPLPWCDIERIGDDGFTFGDERFLVRMRCSPNCVQDAPKRWKFSLMYLRRMNAFQISTFSLAIWGKDLKRRLRASPAGAVYF